MPTALIFLQISITKYVQAKTESEKNGRSFQLDQMTTYLPVYNTHSIMKSSLYVDIKMALH